MKNTLIVIVVIGLFIIPWLINRKKILQVQICRRIVWLFQRKFDYCEEISEADFMGLPIESKTKYSNCIFLELATSSMQEVLNVLEESFEKIQRKAIFKRNDNFRILPIKFKGENFVIGFHRSQTGNKFLFRVEPL